MRGFVPPDPETSVSQVRFAVVYVKRLTRTRFPSGCVEIVTSREEAVAGADPDAQRYAARVIGPSKSSEGVVIYYLAEWLEDGS